MSEMKEFKHGTFCWVELATTDAGAAKKFYGGLFGWTFGDQPVGPDMVYSMAEKNGIGAGGLYQMTKEMKSQGVPPHWLSYVSVADVDESTRRAKSLGAKILREPMDVMDAGRASHLQDPTGAAFALWRAKRQQPVLVNEPGAFTWNELMTTNVDRSGKFYTELFDWTAQTQDMGGTMYTSFMNGDRPAGGMIAITKEMGEIPTNWLVYFATDDCDRAVEKTKSLGGRVDVPPTDIPEVGRFAVAMDPQQAAFAFIQLKNPA